MPKTGPTKKDTKTVHKRDPWIKPKKKSNIATIEKGQPGELENEKKSNSMPTGEKTERDAPLRGGGQKKKRQRTRARNTQQV